MLDELRHRPSEMAFAQGDDLPQALRLDRQDEPFRVRIQVRTSRRQLEARDAGSLQRGLELGPGVPEVVRSFYGAFGGAVLHDGALTIRPSRELVTLWLPGGERGVQFADLSDGRFLAYATTPSRDGHTVMLVSASAKEARVVASRVREVFEHVIEGPDWAR